MGLLNHSPHDRLPTSYDRIDVDPSDQVGRIDAAG